MSQVTLEQALQFAIQHHQAGRLREAEAIYRQALSVYPNHPDALNLLGVALMNRGEFPEALSLIQRAIAQQPSVADFHYHHGVLLNHFDRTNEAITAFQQAISLRPDFPEATGDLAQTLITVKRYEEAFPIIQRAVALQPQNADNYNALAVVLRHKGQFDEAIAAFQRALELRPDFPEAITNLGNLHYRLRQYDQAIALNRRALALKPGSGEIINNLSKCLRESGRFDESVEIHRQMMGTPQAGPDQLLNLANALTRVARFDEAYPLFFEAVEKYPDSALAKTYLAMTHILHGDCEKAWPLFEYRLIVPEMGIMTFDWGKPRWQGEDVAGTIFIYSEQGFGDTIQFARYLPMVKKHCKRLVLGCQNPVARLCRSIPEVDQIVTGGDQKPEFDVQFPLMSLPVIFNTSLQTIPATIPYLKAEPELASRWRKRVPDDKRLKVGLVWAGRPTHDDDHNRSMSPEMLAPLAQVKDVWFCSLQKDPAGGKLPPIELTDWTAELSDFADTAALVENLDLVIAVDTAVAHLVGAMGKPVWVLMPLVPDWRWMRDREDSPWYPTMRLFRQPKFMDWQTPLMRVVASLTEMASQR